MLAEFGVPTVVYDYRTMTINPGAHITHITHMVDPGSTTLMTAPSMGSATAIPKMAEAEEASRSSEIGVEELAVLAACAGAVLGFLLMRGLAR